MLRPSSYYMPENAKISVFFVILLHKMKLENTWHETTDAYRSAGYFSEMHIPG